MDLTQEQREFFEKHSMKMLELAYNYNRHEKVFKPDGYGKYTADCGDTVAISLTTMKKVIQHVSLEIEGCVYTNACANSVAELVEGKTVDDAWEVSAEQVSEMLETLPAESFHCAELAVNALFLALTDFKKRPVTNH